MNASIALKLINSKSINASDLYEESILIAFVKLVIAASLFADLAEAIAFR